jgi:PAS domain S-box-containing protein
LFRPRDSNSDKAPNFIFSSITPRVILRGIFVYLLYLLVFILLDVRAHAIQVLPGIVAWYPPDGLSFAFLLTFGALFLPGVAIASILSSVFVFHFSLPLSDLVGWALLLSLVYGLAVWLLKQRVQIDVQLRRPRDLFWMVTAVVVVSTILAVVSVSANTANGTISQAERPWATVQWWIGEMMGVLVVAPALLIHVMPYVKRFAEGEALPHNISISFPRPSRWVVAEILGILLVMLLVFDVRWPNDFHPYFLIAIPLLWIAIQHGLSGASLGVLMMNFATVRGVQWHDPNFAELGQLQLMMLIMSLSSLFIGIIVSEHKQSLKSSGSEVVRQRNKIISELIIIAIIAVATWILEYTFNFFQAVTAWERRYQIKGLEETLVTISVLGIVWAVFSYRRWKEVETETRAREKAQVELQGLYRELETRVQARTADLSKANELLQAEIAERKQAETALKNAEAKYRILVEQLPAATYIMEYGEITNPVYVSPQIESIFGFTAEEWLADPDLWVNQLYPGDRDKVLAEFNLRDKLNQPIDLDYRIVTREGRVRWIHEQSVLILDETGPRYGHGLIFDITERKQTEEAILQSEKRFRALIENSSDAITLMDPNGVAIYDSPAAPGLLGYDTDELIGRNIFELLHKEDLDILLPLFQSLVATPGARSNNTFRIRHKNGSWRWIEAVVTNLLEEPGVKAIVANYRDITERKLTEEEIRSRTDELSTLYELSRALAEANDVDTVLDLVSRRTVESLHTTFARIALLEGDELIMQSVYPIRVLDHDLFAGSRRPITSMPYCQSFFAQSEPVILHSSTSAMSDEEHAALLLDLAQTLCLIPLRAHDFSSNANIILGVLMIGEVRNEAREPFTPEKLRLARSIGDQAAIAIENIRLFNELERSNVEIIHAYDATITGWSAALDLRDKETEGHTQRVTEMTLRLAEGMKFSEHELIQVRRGALLHDIGKMGIPDRILLKPDKLTDEEWDVMRLHPTYAFQMLKPITYLRFALDIPYCHHEKWDGTGYPRKLSGEHIPIAARIFAVVDVYDALTSDRPYRTSWSREKTLQYIRDLSGSHFDPQIVDAFLKMMEEEV